MKKRYERILIKYIKNKIGEQIREGKRGNFGIASEWLDGLDFRYLNLLNYNKCSKLFIRGEIGRTLLLTIKLLKIRDKKELILWIFDNLGFKFHKLDIIINHDYMITLDEGKYSCVKQ